MTGDGKWSHMTRRDLLLLAGKGTFLFGLGAIGFFFARRAGFLRPPGAREENAFLALCVKCQKCVEICPTRAITQVLVTEDVSAAGTPRLDYSFGYCSLCMRCIEVCPTGALQPVLKESVRLGMAQIVPERCVAWAWMACTKCSKECPEEAISLDADKRPVVEAAKCNGCGLCEYICPAPALRAYRGKGGKGIVIVPQARG